VLASFELHSVPFLSVWVPAVVVLVVNSVLALSFFVPHRTLSAAQGTLTSDGLQVLATLFPTRFRTASLANITAPLRTLAQRRAFWESIGDQTMLCVTLVRAAEAYYEVGDLDAARACWEESASLAVMPGVAPYQRAWNHLLAVRLAEGVVRSDNLDKAEAEFHAAGNRAGVLMVARERVMRFDSRPLSDRDVLLATLQAEAMALGDAPQALYILADRIDLQGALLHQGGQSGDKHDATGLTVLERLASQYDAARVGLESSVADIQVYSQIASARSAAGDDGGAAIAYERALAAARRIYLALAFSPETQRRFAARQVSLVKSAMDCCRRLGRESDAARYAHLLT
jgi:tetratricopeptide (TPR) repeat protein